MNIKKNGNSINTPELSINKAEYVVGIGCSAGSLSALIQFVKGISSTTQAAFILVQHLSPDFNSIMDEILEKHCPIDVKLANDFQIIESGTLYVLEQRTYLSIAGGRIVLSETEVNQYRHPIDYFFKSLSEEFQNRAYGVILSGTGNDGTKGMQSLKQVSALTLCQSPQESEFDGMPNSAIENAEVDHIAGAKDLSRIICEHVDSRLTSDVKISQRKSDFALAEKIFDLIKEASNIDFSEYKIGTAERRIQHRMGVLEINNIQEYYEYVLRENVEISMLAKDMLISVTQFFRDPEVWEALLEQIVKPMIVKKPEHEDFRIWVPGCASGEEAYTLSMIFMYALEELGEHRELRIFGSDIQRSEYRNLTAVIYEQDIEDVVPAKYLERYFINSGGHYELSKRVQANVVFTSHNVADDPPFSNLDLISCRNLLIYFQPSAQKRILSYFHFGLKSNGYLLLGSAETLGSLTDYYFPVDSKNRIYQKNSDTRITLLEAGLKQLQTHKHTKVVEQTNKVKTFLKAGDFSLSAQSVIGRVKDVVLDTYAPPTIITDKQHNIIYSISDTQLFSKKLVPGATSLNISAFLHSDVASAVSVLLKRVEDTHLPVRVENLVMLPENIKLSIEGNFIESPVTQNIENFTVSFIVERTLTSEESDEERDFRRHNQMTGQISKLDAALLDAREILVERQKDIENLAEELQVSNEELMASNEELQSSNEELQSVNEELFTVNSEYQEKIRELEAANFDFDTLLMCTDMGVVYLDANLLIRKFTARAKEFVKLLPLDINRPFTDISLTFEFEGLNDAIKLAKTSKKPVNRLIERADQESINVSINPYTSAQDQIDGVILIFQFIHKLS
ncbi:PAS domain-containing protein [Reinekea forsetii]|nr:PAS domain-containing protein [Reinekea forsetii]